MLSSLRLGFIPVLKKITVVNTRSDRFRVNQKAPKRPRTPLSAVDRYRKEVEPKIKAENPHYSTEEVTLIARRMYKELDKNEKLPYRQAFKADTEQYFHTRLLYECSLTDEQSSDNLLREQRRLCKRKQYELMESMLGKGMPSKPCTEYMFFLSDMKHNRLPCENMEERNKRLSTMWYNLPLEEREQYRNKAKEARQKYHECTAEWGTKIVENFDKWDAIQKIAQEDKTMKTEPVRPPKALLLFKEEMKTVMGVEKIRINKVKKMWDNLSQEEQKRYTDTTQQLYQKYVEEMNKQESAKNTSFDRWLAQVKPDHNL